MSKSKRVGRAASFAFGVLLSTWSLLRRVIEEVRQPGLANHPPRGFVREQGAARARVVAALFVCDMVHARRAEYPSAIDRVRAGREAYANLAKALRERGDLGDDLRAIRIEEESTRLFGSASS